ncbi:MAG: MFS transporter [Mycobacteriales bacterium]
MPFAVGIVITAGLAPKLVDRFGSRILLVGALAAAAGFAGVLLTVREITAAGSLDLAPSMLLAGLGFGLAVIPMADLVLAVVPRPDAGSASGLFTTMQQLGAAVGVAIIGVVFFGALTSHAGGGAEAAVPKLRTELVTAGVPAAFLDPMLEQFRTCARDTPARTIRTRRRPRAGRSRPGRRRSGSPAPWIGPGPAQASNGGSSAVSPWPRFRWRCCRAGRGVAQRAERVRAAANRGRGGSGRSPASLVP